MSNTTAATRPVAALTKVIALAASLAIVAGTVCMVTAGPVTALCLLVAGFTSALWAGRSGADGGAVTALLLSGLAWLLVLLAGLRIALAPRPTVTARQLQPSLVGGSAVAVAAATWWVLL